jgi:hypothetical protein
MLNLATESMQVADTLVADRQRARLAAAERRRELRAAPTIGPAPALDYIEASNARDRKLAIWPRDTRPAGL